MGFFCFLDIEMVGERYHFVNCKSLTVLVNYKHGFVCVPPRKVKIEDVFLAFGNIIGTQNIGAVSQMNKKVVVFVVEVASIVEQGLCVEPYLFRSSRNFEIT